MTKKATKRKLPMKAEMPEMPKLCATTKMSASRKIPVPATTMILEMSRLPAITETAVLTEVVVKKKDRALLPTSITWVVKFPATPRDAVTHLEKSSARTVVAITSGGGLPTKLVRATATCLTLEKAQTPTSSRSTTAEVANDVVVTSNFQAKRADIAVLPAEGLATDLAVSNPCLATTQPHAVLKDLKS